MSPEQRINAEIAKLCPAVARIDGAGVAVWLNDPRKEFEPHTDLNAMHEAVKVLTHAQQNIYAGHLMRIARNSVGSPHWCLANATAAQRAEAFLRTLGLWSTPAAKE